MTPDTLATELRVRQWTKNLVIPAVFLFALGDKQQHLSFALAGMSILAAFIFAVVSSGIYVWNDIVDLELDRAHPVKSRRPLAAGLIQVGEARALSFILLVLGLAAAWLLDRHFGAVAAAYVILQLFYTVFLKRFPLIDVLVIALGFVLRAVAGAVVIDVSISPWLLICTFLMALFLALCKRRHEKRLMPPGMAEKFRPSLGASNERLLDCLIGATAAAVIAAYAVYTQWPDTVAKFGTARLGLTVPLVALGIARYLYLVYNREKGGQPESILLTDLPLLAVILVFGLSVIALIVI